MILKASQRGGGKQLALHLLKTEENEHVEVHDIQGFMADTILGALNEAHAVSRGTRCKQFLFSISLNPPETASVPVETFEDALSRIEAKLGLSGQPRVVVFHEKEGRRHAHAVYSRIDIDEMKAINMSHFKSKLMDVSRELFMEHGWLMPRGMMYSKLRDPATYSLAEYHQARRAKIHPKALKEMFRECWAVSDGKKAFEQALKERGFLISCGDRRGYVALDHTGQIYSITRYCGVKKKEVAERLGAPENLPALEDAQAEMAERMTGTLRRFIQQAQEAQTRRAEALTRKRQSMTQRHRVERQQLYKAHDARWQTETQRRAERLNKGLRGLWDRLTGRNRNVTRQNEMEALEAMRRDRAERDRVVEAQITERQTLQVEVRQNRQRHSAEAKRLYHDIAGYKRMQRDVDVERLSPNPELARALDLSPNVNLDFDP
jgi:hypothetical protein